MEQNQRVAGLKRDGAGGHLEVVRYDGCASNKDHSRQQSLRHKSFKTRPAHGQHSRRSERDAKANL